MYNWNNLTEYKQAKSLFYEYFRWQKYDSYLNLFYSNHSDVLGGESVMFDEVVEFFEQHRILLNVISYYGGPSHRLFFKVEIYNDLDKTTICNIKDSQRAVYLEREEAQIFAIDTALKILEKNLVSDETKIKFKNERNVENNCKEFFQQ